MTKRTGLILLCTVLCILLVYVLANHNNPDQSNVESTPPVVTEVAISILVDEYNRQITAYNEAAMAYNDSIQVLADANSVLDKAIADAQAVLDSGDIPFDPGTTTNLGATIQSASMARVSLPDLIPAKVPVDIPDGATAGDINDLRVFLTDDANSVQVDQIPLPLSAPDYTQVITDLANAQRAYEQSVTIQRQITAPSDDFVLERLKQIDSILSLAAVTKSNDPNGLLETEGGYIGCIYFSDSRVDKTKLDLNPSQYDVISMGTIGGGAIEIYATREDAEARNQYLSKYDGTDLDPGSHTVLGTMVIRASSQLSEKQQGELTNQIVDLMTELIDDTV